MIAGSRQQQRRLFKASPSSLQLRASREIQIEHWRIAGDTQICLCAASNRVIQGAVLLFAREGGFFEFAGKRAITGSASLVDLIA